MCLFMRPSPLRHTLAVLRSFLRLTQKEMADIVECSTPTIQAIELGKLNLSEKLGVTLATKTGVSLDWLMQNDVTAPVVDRSGETYTKEAFESIRAHDFADLHRIFPEYFNADTIAGLCTAMVMRTLLIGHRHARTDITAYRLGRAIKGVLDLDKQSEYLNLQRKWEERLKDAAENRATVEEVVQEMWRDYRTTLTEDLHAKVKHMVKPQRTNGKKPSSNKSALSDRKSRSHNRLRRR